MTKSFFYEFKNRKEWAPVPKCIEFKFTIYLDLQADCDDSFQFVFFWAVKKDSIPDTIEVSLSELCQTEVDSTHEIHTHFLNSSMRFLCKMLQIIPFAHLPHLLLTYLAYVAGPSKSCINSNEIIKMNLLTVSLSSLYRCGDELNRFSILMNSDPKTFLQYYFSDTLRIHW